MSVEVVDVNLKMAPTKKVSKSKQVREYKILEILKKNFKKSEVAKIGPIYPVFELKKVKKGNKTVKKLVLKEKRIWVQWKTSSKKESWTAEPLKHFSGASKKEAEASIAKGQCWPWVEKERIDVLKAEGILALSFFRRITFLF